MSAKDEYTHWFFLTGAGFGTLIAQMTDVRDLRISPYMDQWISGVTDAETREGIRAKKKEYYREALGEYKDPSPVDRATAMLDACTRVAGDLWSWIDRVVGMTTEMTYGVCGIMPGEEDDEAKFGGGGDADVGNSDEGDITVEV